MIPLTRNFDTIPDGCVVWNDGDDDWLCWAPELVVSMRAHCPICESGRAA